MLNISAHPKYLFLVAVYADRALSTKFHPRENFFYLSYKALDSGGWKDRMGRKEDSNDLEAHAKASHLPSPQARIGRNVGSDTDP